MSVTDKVKREVHERDGEACAVCYSMVDLERTPHHCWFKSKYYGKDKNDPWNLVNICIDCHSRIHGSGSEIGKIYRKKCEQTAYERASDETKEKLKILSPESCSMEIPNS